MTAKGKDNREAGDNQGSSPEDLMASGVVGTSEIRGSTHCPEGATGFCKNVERSVLQTQSFLD